MKTSFRVVSNLEHFPLTHQNENEIAYECKANENLNEQTKFSKTQNHKEKLQHNDFSNYSTFSQTEINRTPRSLL